MSLASFWKKIIESPSFRPACIKIKPENTDKAERLQEPLVDNKHYFEVVVNEMFLSYKRKWLHSFDPLVFTVSEFLYDGAKASVPFVVGPGLIKDKISNLPDAGGMIYRDTTVASLTPYTGGTLAISIVLMRLPIENYLRKILKILENASRTYGNEFASVVGGYLKIAHIISDGIESITDSDDVKPLVGVREEFKQDGNLQPGYFVLINEAEENFAEENFFVKNNQLYYGKSFQESSHYRDGDYVLYSIMSGVRRSDISMLPFYQTWKELNKYISEIDDKHLNDDQSKKVRGKLFALQNAIRFSPDLTRAQAANIITDYMQQVNDLVANHNAASGGHISSTRPKDQWEAEMDKMASEILSG
jgi:hypothetical protein